MSNFSLASLDVQPNPGEDGDERVRIQVGEEPETIRAVTEHINEGTLPDLYVTNGRITHVSQVSGDTDAGGDDQALPVKAATLTPAGLARALAEHTETFKTVKRKDGEMVDIECTPSKRALEAVLSQLYWPGVRPLRGIVGAPVLRPDGTLLQTRGYDRKTGLYYAPKVPLPPIPDVPTADDVAAARMFLLGRVLRDFPWVSPADRANYVGLLVTQILRPMFASLSPLGLITATTQSSGKTILSDLIGQLFGQKLQPWVRSEPELRKAITAILATTVGTVLFDNVKEGLAIDSPTLATLMTAPMWSDRLLGANETFTAANDRLWLITGNNLRLGGDMATRTIAVRLDPGVPRPEARTGFTIPNLDRWVRDPGNHQALLRHLLVLALDWVNAGATTAEHTMRQFSPWASTVGGFLAHHGVEQFLGNAEDVRGLDEENAEWTAFLARWYRMYSSQRLQAKKLIDAARPYGFGPDSDPWEGDFLTGEDGQPLRSIKSLSMFLRGQIGRYHGEYVLRSEKNKSTNATDWWVEQYEGGAK